MSYKDLRVLVGDDGIAVVSLSRPPVNALCRNTYDEIHRLFENPDDMGDNIKVVILNGMGKHFCAGNDLGDFELMTPATAREYQWRVRQALRAIQSCPVPVIAAVHGACLGAGVALLASADFGVAEPDARIGLPELGMGVMGGASHLARLAPPPLVKRMFLTAEPMSAADLLAAGGAIEVCGAGRVQDVALAHARRVASFSPTAVRLAKQALDKVDGADLIHDYEVEQEATILMSGHPDSEEALSAFREKRAPVYQAWTQRPLAQRQ